MFGGGLGTSLIFVRSLLLNFYVSTQHLVKNADAALLGLG